VFSKSDIRKNIRDQRKSLSSEDVQSASHIICEKIVNHPDFINAQKIALYISHDNEIDVLAILKKAWELKKLTCLPVVTDKNELAFYTVTAKTKFIKNKFGIDEPMISSQSPVSPTALDLIVIPLVAFDANNNRLGRGAGYYDRALQFTQTLSRDKRPVLMGVAYAFQKADDVMPDRWDVRMDEIICDK
jgi:5-formyltetrahydrofolate cyclo-ligase